MTAGLMPNFTLGVFRRFFDDLSGGFEIFANALKCIAGGKRYQGRSHEHCCDEKMQHGFHTQPRHVILFRL